MDIWGPKFEKIWDKCQNLEILKSEAKIWKNLEKFGSKFLTVPDTDQGHGKIWIKLIRDPYTKQGCIYYHI